MSATPDEREYATLYARLSRLAGAANTSKQGMIDDLMRAADRAGYATRPDMIHMDDGVSGAVRDRPEFMAWLDDAREGKAAAMIGYATDRLSREGVNVAGMILDVVEGKDPRTGKVTGRPVRLLDESGRIDSERGDTFRLMFAIEAEAGRSERQRIRARNTAKTRRLREAGRWPGGPPPYGYRIEALPDDAGKTLVINESEAEALREAASRILDGQPLGKVARWLSETGAIKPRRADAFSRVVLRQALTSDAIAGRITLAGRVLPDVSFPAVLEFPTVLLLRSKLTPLPDAAKTPGRGPSRLLSGLLTCHSCEAALQATSRSDGTRAYGCLTRSSGGVCEGSVSVSGPLAEAYLESVYLAAAGPMPETRRVVSVEGGNAARLADIEVERHDLNIALTTAGTPRAERLDLLDRLDALDAEAATLAAAKTWTIVREVATGRTRAEAWATANTDDRRDMLRSAFEELVVFPARRGGSRYRDFSGPDRISYAWSDATAELLAEHVAT